MARNTSVKIIGAVAALALIVGSIALMKAPVVQQAVQKAGSLAGPDIQSLYLRWGGGKGVQFYAYNYPLTTATTTPCNIQSPAATSTLRSGGIQMTTSTSTAFTLAIAKAASSNATTTLLATSSVSSGAQVMLSAIATTTALNADQVTAAGNFTFAPSTWIVFGMSGGTGTFSPVGECHATFEAYL